MQHLAKLSHLHFELDTPESKRVQNSISSVLNCARLLKSTLNVASTSAAAVADAGLAGAGTGSMTTSGVIDEALAEARFAELRKDVVTEGGNAEAVLSHVSGSDVSGNGAERGREGPYFAVPKFVEE